MDKKMKQQQQKKPHQPPLPHTPVGITSRSNFKSDKLKGIHVE